MAQSKPKSGPAGSLTYAEPCQATGNSVTYVSNGARRAACVINVRDDLPDSLPVTEAELDLYEAYLGDILSAMVG